MPLLKYYKVSDLQVLPEMGTPVAGHDGYWVFYSSNHILFELAEELTKEQANEELAAWYAEKGI